MSDTRLNLKVIVPAVGLQKCGAGHGRLMVRGCLHTVPMNMAPILQMFALD